MEKDLEKLIHEALKEDGYEKDLTSTAIIDLKKAPNDPCLYGIIRSFSIVLCHLFSFNFNAVSNRNIKES